MPKRNFKSRPFKKRSFKKRTFKKRTSKRFSRGELMTNRSDPRRHTVIADRYSTRMFTELLFSLTDGSLPTTQYFDVLANQLYQPFNTSATDVQKVGSLTGYTHYGGAVDYDELNPNGLEDLGLLYACVMTRASKITVNLTPQATAESVAYAVRMCVFPWWWSGSGSSLPQPFIPTTFDQAQVMPYAKTITCTLNNNIKMNTINNYVVMHKLYGYTRQQYEDDPATRFLVLQQLATVGQGYRAVYWRVMYQIFDGASTVASNLAMDVKVQYYSEFQQPLGTFGIGYIPGGGETTTAVPG